MKKVLLTAGAMLLWTGTVCAGAGDMVRIPADDYRAILKRLDTLQNRVDTLEGQPAMSRPAARPSVSAAPSGVDGARLDKLQEDVNNIYDTLDQVETKTLKDRINFGGEYRLRYDSFKYEDLRVSSTDGQPPEDLETEHKDNMWTNRFRLNMDANISKSLKFHGRMAVYHAWGDHDTIGSTNFYNDGNAVHALGDDGLKLDRFYIDWIPQGFPLPIAITVGRHPSTEGPPVEFKENRKRQSTYPALIFDGEADGIVATLGLESWTGLKSAGLRVAYGKVYHSDDNNTDNSIIDHGDTKDSNILAGFFESQIPGVENSLMVLSYAHIFDMPAAMIEDAAYSGIRLGDCDMYGLHFQASNIANVGLDAYLSGSINETDPEDNSAVAWGGMPPVSFLTNGDDEAHTGWSVLAGLRYELPIQALNNPKFGFEYNHGSRYHFTMTSGANELYNKLATRGDAYELYYIQPVSKNLFFRAGYTYIEYDYSGSGQPGYEPVKLEDWGLDTTMTNIYMLMDVRF